MTPNASVHESTNSNTSVCVHQTSMIHKRKNVSFIGSFNSGDSEVRVYTSVKSGSERRDTDFANTQIVSNFSEILHGLSKLFDLPPGSLNIFLDIETGPLVMAFNCNGTIFCSLRYYETYRA